MDIVRRARLAQCVAELLLIDLQLIFGGGGGGDGVRVVDAIIRLWRQRAAQQ